MNHLSVTLIYGLVLLAQLCDLAQGGNKHVRQRSRGTCDGVCKEYTCGTPNRDGRVVGGTPTSVGQYPWLAALYYRSKLYCGATLVTDRHLVTAAHCVQRVRSGYVRIMLGSYNKSNTDEEWRQERKIGKSFPHPDFERRSYNNDIAVIELDIPVTITKYVRPVCLPTTTNKTYEGILATVPGWGRQSESGDPSEVVREVKVPIMTNEECKKKKYKPHEITDNMMCAGYDEGKIDACQGDSGGPLLYNNGKNIDLIGVVSWGQGCARAKFPGVYARISNYIDFITSKLKDDGCFCPEP
ncbi:venom protease [Procambarus clarkii]|uniref:venom protease n=1 Tax=Procambarus clarkii TaxID=6728 RepID=UPI001E672567|nr:venom protease-like [Procambarus clarkii]